MIQEDSEWTEDMKADFRKFMAEQRGDTEGQDKAGCKDKKPEEKELPLYIRGLLERDKISIEEWCGV